MAAQTGRTVSKWLEVHIDDSGGTLREVDGIKSVNGIGLEYAEEDVTALTEALMNVLPNRADVVIELVGHVDNTADTGFHTVFSGINGGNTPLSFDARIGVRHTWESGEPQFGITSTATSGMICTSYIVDPDNMEGRARLRVMGSTAPDWGTSAET